MLGMIRQNERNRPIYLKWLKADTTANNHIEGLELTMMNLS
jgi:hypothetical protein